MALESQADFNAYISTSGHGVTGTFFEVQQSLWDDRLGLIDTWYDIDSGNAENIKFILDQAYFGIPGGSVDINAYQPVAYIKSTDAPYISHADRLIVNPITTKLGKVIAPETSYKIINVQKDNVGFVTLLLEEE